jgi:hypothetical protein
MASSGRSKFLKRICMGLGILMVLMITITVAWLFPLVRLAYALFVVTVERPKSLYRSADSRGDVLIAKTDLSGGPPFVTIITLVRAHMGSRITLAKVTSSKFRADLQWFNNDRAQVVIHVDKNGLMSQPLVRVGQTQIKYSFRRDF